MDINKIDIGMQRMRLHSQQQNQFVGGQRISGALADFLNQADELLNALALHQGQPELVYEPPAVIPEAVTGPSRLADRLDRLNAQATGHEAHEEA